MHKWEVKRILNTMRTPYNEKEVNLVLARVDMTPNFRLEKLIAEFGDDKNAVVQYFQENIDQMCDKNDDKVPPTRDNKYVASCILRDSQVMFVQNMSSEFLQYSGGTMVENIEEQPTEETVRDIVTLHMLDSMKQLMEKIDAGDPEVAKLKQLRIFLDGAVDMPDKYYDRYTVYGPSMLKDPNVLANHSEIRKAVEIYGSDKDLRFATISMETFKSKEFRNLMTAKIKAYEARGLKVEPAEEVKEDVTPMAPSNCVDKKAQEVGEERE